MEELIMTKKTPFEKDDVAKLLGERRLANIMPPLERYLQSCAKVLDVGCGPGSITLDASS
jgi:hypothetical protein